MTLATDIPLDQQQHFVLDDASWDIYEHLLEEVGNRPIRMTYYEGSLEIMSPLPKHDRWGWRIGTLISMLCVERNIPMVGLGSTTFRNKRKKVGLEPDECFYIQHWEVGHQMEGPFDPAIHAPPDLAVEIDISRKSIPKQPIYAILGVPELWRFDGKQLQVLALVSGQYEPRSSSLAFPFLPIPDFEKFLERMATENDMAVVRSFQEWVRTLKT